MRASGRPGKSSTRWCARTYAR
ncbi:MAG: hypothetical protein QOD39_509, partial [Mycobacterium sp.]|nr:hypothetical protein [Mycobacterium sp.]